MMFSHTLQTSLRSRLLQRLFFCALLITFAAGFIEWRARTKTVAVRRKTSVRNEESASTSSLNRGDSDRDGIPDVAELKSFSDRARFRIWFTAIAEMQFYTLSDEWSKEQRDCAGLVRFSLREALRPHDREWFKRMGSMYEVYAPDVESYTLEKNPLGEKLFRTSDNTFSEYADGRTLKEFNCTFISRDRRRALPGDLLFFFQPWSQKFPYHVMLFLGEGTIAPQGGARDWVVYHTGASATDEGVVKKVRLSVLDRHPDKRWRPVESNPNFLGFYRLKILD